VRALVIYGGGSKGTYARGIAEYMIYEASKKYHIFSSCPFLVRKTTTGLLHAPESYGKG